MGNNFFQMNCLQATLLVERKLAVGISFWDQWRLRMHQRLCAYCKNYEVQSKLIDHAFEQQDKVVFKLPAEVKIKLKKKIEALS